MTRTAAALAIVALLAAPAGARERRHRDTDSGISAIVAGALIAGGVAALLAARKEVAAPPGPLTESSPDENDAANACAEAAERQMLDDGREARVERFASVTPRAKGGYKVKGDIRVADAGDGYRMRFSCAVKGVDVRSVTLSV